MGGSGGEVTFGGRNERHCATEWHFVAIHYTGVYNMLSNVREEREKRRLSERERESQRYRGGGVNAVDSFESYTIKFYISRIPEKLGNSSHVSSSEFRFRIGNYRSWRRRLAISDTGTVRRV